MHILSYAMKYQRVTVLFIWQNYALIGLILNNPPFLYYDKEIKTMKEIEEIVTSICELFHGPRTFLIKLGELL